MKRRLPYLMTMTAVLCCSTAALADPPSRVGRLSYTEGTVSFHAADEDDWSLAGPNYPVTTGDAFWTEPDARSEIQIGVAEIRMDHTTELDVDQLDDDATRINLPQGVANFHLSAVPSGGSLQVMTPAGEIDLVQPGTYHIDSGHPSDGVDSSHPSDGAAPQGQVQVTALEGEVQVKGSRAMLEVMPGETAVINADPPSFALQEGNATPFDDWALSREKREREAAALQYVSPQMTGYQDLDRYGAWSQDPAYGTVWYPASVDPDWAPYRAGHWISVQPWGWTWVDDAPWGFAPFHYGRWVQVGQRWGWTPGAIAERPVYAPALVAFIGGPGWSVSLSAGAPLEAVGWVPLGPREVFHPYYPVSIDYARNVNVAYVDKTVINNITVNNIHETNVTVYANQRAATVVPAAAFTRGAPVRAAAVSVPAAQLMKAPAASSLDHLQPTATARRGGDVLPAAEKAGMPHPAAISHEGGPHEGGMKGEPAPGVEKNPAAAGHAPQPGMKPEEAAPHPASNEKPQGEEKPAAAQNRPAPERNPAQVTNAAPAHAPGPAIRHPAPAATPHAPPGNPHSAENHAAPLPHAEVPHPPQATHMTPTPQGWQRKPAPAADHGAKHEEPPHDGHEGGRP